MVLVLLATAPTMRARLLIPALSIMLVACHNDDPGNTTTPDAASPTPDAASATTIHISSPAPPVLVVVRDGITAAWQPATMNTPTSFEAEVHGPYIVAAVCEENGIFLTRQIGETLEDSHDIDVFCVGPTDNRKITGHMVQAGQVFFGPSGEESFRADWNFELDVPDGTYDLFAWSSDHVAVRRRIAVNADLAVTPPVDVVQQGVPLADVAFSATNATASEQLRASVLFGPGEVYNGPIATAKIVPDAVFVTTDTQTVSLQATSGTNGRSLRRPFRVDGDTTYTLPAPLGAVQWKIENGQLVVSWATTPARHNMFAPSLGLSTDHSHTAAYTLGMSSAFIAATQITSATFGNDIPGYKPEWQIDFTGQYSREIDFQQVESEQSMTIWEAEFIPAPASGPSASPMSRVSRGAAALRR